MSDDMDYDDLTFFIETLSHLTTKDYIDFSQSGNFMTIIIIIYLHVHV